MGIVPPCASFFEVADPSTEATHKEPSLALPRAFVERFHTYLSQTLVLEIPGGEMWNAGLEVDSEKRLRITYGWKDLAERLSVQSGDLLVLDLVSKGHFQVYIYEGEDMCEKDLSKVKYRDSDDKDMHATITPERFANSKKRKGEVMDKCKVHTRSNVGQNQTNGGPLEIIPYQRSSDTIKKCATLRDLQQVLPSFHKKTQNAFEAALSYSSENPFTIVKMMHSSVCHGFKVGVPTSFAKQHMDAEPKQVALIDSENKAWSVTWLGYNSEPIFSGGWRYFVIDHHLKCGDICIFEKRSSKPICTFKVHIFRVDKDDGPMMQQVIPSKISNVIGSGYT